MALPARIERWQRSAVERGGQEGFTGRVALSGVPPVRDDEHLVLLEEGSRPVVTWCSRWLWRIRAVVGRGTARRWGRALVIRVVLLVRDGDESWGRPSEGWRRGGQSRRDGRCATRQPGHSVEVLRRVYSKILEGFDDTWFEEIDKMIGQRWPRGNPAPALPRTAAYGCFRRQTGTRHLV